MLSSCSKKELDRLEHFLECKAYNSDKAILALFKAIKNLINKKLEYDDNAEAVIFHKIYTSEKGKPSNSLNTKQKQKVNTLFSELTRLTEQFLIYESIEENPVQKVELLQKKLLLKSQYQLYNRHFNKQIKEREKKDKKGLEFYKLAKVVEDNQLDYLYNTGNIYTHNNIDQLNEYLDIEYLLQKLSLYATKTSLQEVTNSTNTEETFEAFNTLLNTEKYGHLPQVIIFGAYFNLVKDKSVENYYTYLRLLREHHNQLSNKYLKYCYVIATNFCVREIKKGEYAYDQVYDLYKTMDEKEILLENEAMPVVKLKNIVNVSCRVNDFDWAAKMISKYIPYVQKSVSDLVFRYNLGVIAFYKKDYKEAINHFVYGDGINLSYDVNNRTMIMKAHYEIDKEYDERTLQIYRSTEKYFVTNKQLSKTDITAYKNFIRSLINVYRIRFRSTKMTLESLKSKIEKQELNSDRKWLNDKIEELS